MSPEQQQAILAIGLLAAFADGAHDAREREQIRQLAESLVGNSGAAGLAGLYQQVLLKRLRLQDAVTPLTDPAHRQLAYEMAVCVCDADGHLSAAERDFLDTLASALGLDAALTAPIEEQAGEMAELAETAAPASVASPAPLAVEAIPAPASPPPDAETERRILNQAILCGALELLPQSWASMAIIPLQIRLVYTIGKAHGYELDQGHIRELLATVGVGMGSQYLEQFGRKLIGGLLGKIGGGLGRGVGRAATGMAFSFATTYALGQVARRYYGGGRQMSTALLKDSYAELLGRAKGIQSQYLPQIEDKARTLDMQQVIGMVRGS